jgi:hypothetical protein
MNDKHDRIMNLIAIAHYCNDYHSGQSSRGYKILCRAMKILRDEYGINRPIDFNINVMPAILRKYRQLEDNYIGDI